MHSSMIPGKSIDQIAEYRALTRCGVNELAAHQYTAPPSSGVLFARKSLNGAGEGKAAARDAVVELIMPEMFPGPISVLSMPCVDWTFERKLMSRREGPGGTWYQIEAPTRTRLTCVENDRSIYHGAMLRMPGLRSPGSLVTVLPATRYSERVLQTKWLHGFHFANVYDLMQHTDDTFNVAWIDLTGPVKSTRMEIIRDFFARSVSDTLILTTLKARWDRRTSDSIEHAGSLSAWLTKRLPGTVLHDIEYQDGHSPMHQIAIRKEIPNAT